MNASHPHPFRKSLLILAGFVLTILPATAQRVLLREVDRVERGITDSVVDPLGYLYLVGEDSNPSNGKSMLNIYAPGGIFFATYEIAIEHPTAIDISQSDTGTLQLFIAGNHTNNRGRVLRYDYDRPSPPTRLAFYDLAITTPTTTARSEVADIKIKDNQIYLCGRFKGTLGSYTTQSGDYDNFVIRLLNNDDVLEFDGSKAWGVRTSGLRATATRSTEEFKFAIDATGITDKDRDYVFDAVENQPARVYPSSDFDVTGRSTNDNDDIDDNSSRARTYEDVPNLLIDAPSSGNDIAHSLAIDDSGNVYISGQWPAFPDRSTTGSRNVTHRRANVQSRTAELWRNGNAPNPLTLQNGSSVPDDTNGTLNSFTIRSSYENIGWVVEQAGFGLPVAGGPKIGPGSNMGYIVKFDQNLSYADYRHTSGARGTRSNYFEIIFGNSFVYAIGAWKGTSNFETIDATGSISSSSEESTKADVTSGPPTFDIEVLQLGVDLSGVGRATAKGSGSFWAHSLDIDDEGGLFVSGVIGGNNASPTAFGDGLDTISRNTASFFVGKIKSNMTWDKVVSSEDPAPNDLLSSQPTKVRWNQADGFATFAGNFRGGSLTLGPGNTAATLEAANNSQHVNFLTLVNKQGGFAELVRLVIRSEESLIQDVVTPPVPSEGFIEALKGAPIDASVPAVVYVDADKQILRDQVSGYDVSEEQIRDQAKTRFTSDGYTIGKEVTRSEGNRYSFILEEDTEITFHWKVEHAVEIESDLGGSGAYQRNDGDWVRAPAGDPNEGIGLTNTSGGQPDPVVKKHWIPEDELFTAFINGADVDGTIPGTRYRVMGYQASGSAALTETTELETVGDTGGSLDGKYFTLHDQAGSVAVWFDIDDSGTVAPTHGASRALEVTSVRTDSTAAQVAAALAAALDSDPSFSTRIISEGATIVIFDQQPGLRSDATLNTSGFSIQVTTQGVAPEVNVPEVTDLQTSGVPARNLDGKYLVLHDASGSVAVWFDIDDSGTTEPNHDSDRALEISTVNTGDSEETVASSVATALTSDPSFSAIANGSRVTITDASSGDRENARDINTGFLFRTVAQTHSESWDYQNQQQVPQFTVSRPGKLTYLWTIDHRLIVSTTQSKNQDLPFVDVIAQPSGNEAIDADGSGEFWFPRGSDLFVGVRKGGFGNQDIQIEFANGDIPLNPTLEDRNITVPPGGLQTLRGFEVTDFSDENGSSVAWGFGEDVFREVVTIGDYVKLRSDNPYGFPSERSFDGNLGSFEQDRTPNVQIIEGPAGSSASDMQIWDDDANRSYPLRPGRYFLEFATPDATADPVTGAFSDSIVFEIIAGFPGDEIFPDQSPPRLERFPGEIDFRHLRHPEIPSVAMDPNKNDDLYFQDLKYTENNVGVVADGEFSAQQDARHVFLFSRAKPGNVAIGDLDNGSENVVVRTAETRAWDSLTSWRVSQSLVLQALDGGSLTPHLNTFDTTGTLTALPPIAATNVQAFAAGDLDGDGHADLVTGAANQTNQVLLSDSTSGSFLAPASLGTEEEDTTSIAIADLNDDGNNDLVVGNRGAPNRIYLGDGSGMLTEESAAGLADTQTLDLVLSEVSGDAFADLITIDHPGGIRLYLNSGVTADPFAGVSATTIGGAGAAATALAAGAIDGSAGNDLVVGRSDGAIEVFSNGGGANPFAGAPLMLGPGTGAVTDLELADIDGNNTLDIVVAHAGGANLVYLNNGAGAFAAVGVSGDVRNTLDVAILDANRDGLPDIVSGNLNEIDRLYLNDGTADPFASLPGIDLAGGATPTLALLAGAFPAQPINLQIPATATIGSKISSPFDTAGIETGFLVYPNARYNPNIYRRSRVADAGPIIPVNQHFEHDLTTIPFEADDNDLAVVWYERRDGILWPWQTTYHLAEWPLDTPRIVIASRLGSEGQNQNLDDQLSFDRERFDAVSVYVQNNKSDPGYNPNEEHALIAPSFKFLDQANPPPTAYALRNDLNITTPDNSYTSHPRVLVEYLDKEANDGAGEFKMAVYRIQLEDPRYTTNSPYLFPEDDPDPEDPNDQREFPYVFHYKMKAGEPVQAPYPLGGVIGLTPCKETFYRNGRSDAQTNPPVTYYRDYKLGAWAVSGGTPANPHSLRSYYYYPLALGFWYNIDNSVNTSDTPTPTFLVTVAKEGNVTDASAGDSGFTVTVPQNGTVSSREKVSVTPVADSEGSLDGLYFLLYDGNADSVAIWIDVDDDGATEPTHGATRSVEVTGVRTNDSAEQVAAAVASAIQRDRAFVASFGLGQNDGRLMPPGSCVPWLPPAGPDNPALLRITNRADNVARNIPLEVRYDAVWPDDLPVLKAGETLTHAGGEFRADNTQHPGLPGVIGWAAGRVVFDSQNPTMRSSAAGSAPNSFQNYSARLIAPLEERRVNLPLTDAEKEEIAPATGITAADGFTWIFTELPSSLQKRVFYDVLDNKLGIRGFVNDKTLGDQTLTAAPPPVYVMEPNILSEREKQVLLELEGLKENAKWRIAVENLFAKGRNPLGMARNGTDDPASFYAGLEEDIVRDPRTGDPVLDASGNVQSIANSAVPKAQLGPGLALVPSPELLEPDSNRDKVWYVTMIENDNEDLGGPISLHIVRIEKKHRYRGAIKTILSDNVFDEKITLRHSGDFGANSDDIVYQWYYREADGIESPLPPASPWKIFPDQSNNVVKGLAMNQITLDGTGGLLLADNLFFVRYRHKDDVPLGFDLPSTLTVEGDPYNGVDWTGEDINGDGEFTTQAEYRTEWFRDGKEFLDLFHRENDGTVTEKRVHGGEWAGAANSPSVEGVYRPQLASGWIKRVLDRVNPYEARINDFRTTDAPATYVSMIQQAGRRPEGPVALNPDKNVIENVGLIELYQTILDRGTGLSIDLSSPITTPAINNALMLAATRLSDFYMLLGNEAFSDALDPTIGFGSSTSDFGYATPSIFTFQNQVGSLLEEELSLLRGVSESFGRPVYNRLFWNFTKSDGEVAYAMNYNLFDQNLDGFTNEADAMIMYPQGHGDAWGHYTTAVKMHYNLLRHRFFNWQTRSEQYNLLDVVIDVDFLDERKFAQAAAARAKAGAEIVEQTYRSRYVAEPDGQWQGYTDTDEDRAWGVEGWARRSGQAAYIDWVTANALIPSEDTENQGIVNESLKRIDRSTVTSINRISKGLGQIQQTYDNANDGLNPLGLADGVVPFDIDPGAFDGSAATSTVTHFDQILKRAEKNLTNAVKVFDHANKHENRVRRQQEKADDFTWQTRQQDRSYRNQLIQIFGTPYEGVIGTGKPYPAGYAGPDLMLWMYVDVRDVDNNTVPPTNETFTTFWEGFPQQVLTVNDLDNADDPNNVNTGEDGDLDPDDAEKRFETTLKHYFINDRFDVTTTDDVDAFSPKEDVFASITDTDLFDNGILELDLPIRAEGYAFQAPRGDTTGHLENWGRRAAPGELQKILSELVQAEAALALAVGDYDVHIAQTIDKAEKIEARHGLATQNIEIKRGQAIGFTTVNAAIQAGEIALRVFKRQTETVTDTAEVMRQSAPTVQGAGTTVIFDPGIYKGTITSTSKAVKKGFDILGDVVEQAISLANASKDTVAMFNDIELAKEGYEFDLRQDLKELENILRCEGAFRIKVFRAQEALRQKSDQFRSVLEKGQRLLDERHDYNRHVAGVAQDLRYQDMAFRVFRNDALQKYNEAFDLAARYVYLAARAYDYETNLDPSDPGSASSLFTEIVRSRTLGHVNGGPTHGGGGLSEILAVLRDNNDVLKGRLGIINPQREDGKLSLRNEHYRIKNTSRGNTEWRQQLRDSLVPDLWDLPEFRRYCRAPAPRSAGALPGLVLEFDSEIVFGRNFFGWPLGGGDHAYDPTNYATKILGAGVWFEGYNNAELAVAPRVYLVPAGLDVMTVPNSPELAIREWNVVDQAIPVPYPIGDNDLTDPLWRQVTDSLAGPEAEIRKFSSFRAYGNNTSTVSDDQLVFDSRLVGRSVWNTKWLLIIPGGTLHADGDAGLERFMNDVDDIKLFFKTFGYSGN